MNALLNGGKYGGFEAITAETDTILVQSSTTEFWKYQLQDGTWNYTGVLNTSSGETGQVIKPDASANWTAVPEVFVPKAPKSITMRQARLALLLTGKLDIVQAAIDAMPEQQKKAALITWDYSSEVQKDNPLVVGLAPVLGLTEKDLDDLFVFASTL